MRARRFCPVPIPVQAAGTLFQALQTFCQGVQTRMSLPLIQLLAAVFFVVSLTSGVWLIFHLVSLAAAFDGYADLVPADARPRVSRVRILIAMLLLVGGAGACLLIALYVAGMLPAAAT